MRAFQVRRPMPGLQPGVETFGDGVGGENTIRSGDAALLALFATYDPGSALKPPLLRVYFSNDGTSFFQTAAYVDGASPMVGLQMFEFPVSAFTNVILVPVRGDFCRISITLDDAEAPSARLAIQAELRGRCRLDGCLCC